MRCWITKKKLWTEDDEEEEEEQNKKWYDVEVCLWWSLIFNSLFLIKLNSILLIYLRCVNAWYQIQLCYDRYYFQFIYIFVVVVVIGMVFVHNSSWSSCFLFNLMLFIADTQMKYDFMILWILKWAKEKHNKHIHHTLYTHLLNHLSVFCDNSDIWEGENKYSDIAHNKTSVYYYISWVYFFHLLFFFIFFRRLLLVLLELRWWNSCQQNVVEFPLEHNFF